MRTENLYLRTGDIVEVKSLDEILGTLDEAGCLDGMPFMPEMLQFCGKQLRISKVAHKTCDTQCKTGGRSIKNCVHLEKSRCDGAGHDGCQAQCNLFWKIAWLRRPHASAQKASSRKPNGLSVEALARLARDGSRYRCQVTQLVEASQPLAWWDVRQYVRDFTSRNAPVGKVLQVLILSWFAAWRRYGYPYRLSHWVYDRSHRLLMGREPPYPPDNISYPTKSLAGSTKLKAGELVRIKSHLAIRKTLNAAGYNRGLWFDVEMVPYCGREFRVSQRVAKIINEKTGEMMHMKNPCIMLQGVVCQAEYSDRRLLCPRAIPSYWREIWLERVQQNARPAQSDPAAETSVNPAELSPKKR